MQNHDVETKPQAGERDRKRSGLELTSERAQTHTDIERALLKKPLDSFSSCVTHGAIF